MFQMSPVLESLFAVAGRQRKKGRLTRSKSRQPILESLERREVMTGQVIISEIHPSGSGNSSYGADWFEVTNAGRVDLEVAGWRMDDSSNAFATSVELRGVTAIPAGKSAVLIESNADGSSDARTISSSNGRQGG
jgi:hypothetical protein